MAQSTAFISTAQYLANLTPNQDTHYEILRIVKNAYNCRFICFGHLDESGEIALAENRIVAHKIFHAVAASDEIKEMAREVIDSEFLANDEVELSETYTVIILPIKKADGVNSVLVIGHEEGFEVDNDMLNEYLGIASLAGTMMNRLKLELEQVHALERERRLTRELDDLNRNLEKRVEDRTREILLEKEKTDRILQTITDGLITFNNSHKIGPAYSRVTEDILMRRQIREQDFLDVLGGMLHDSHIDSAKTFIELLFERHDLSEELLLDVNPLKEVEAKIGSTGGDQDEITKYLQFKFNRIYENDQIVEVMAKISDVTEQTILNRKLEEQQKKAEKERELFFAIFRISPPLLNEFLEEAEGELATISRLIETHRECGGDFRERIDAVYRAMHTLKGHASLIELSVIAQQAHVFEDRIRAIKDQGEFDDETLQSIIDMTEDIHGLLNQSRDIVKRLADFRESHCGETIDANVLLLNTVKKTVDKLCKQEGKEVAIDSSGFDTRKIPKTHNKVIKDVLIQLIRNSIIHGIESTEKRKELGKEPRGLIRLTSNNKCREGEIYTITLEDDGQGLDLRKLKEKAIESGEFSEEQVERWDRDQLADVIFLPGVSTAENITMNAGRGVGMDIIRHNLIKNNGAIDISFEEGKFCRFDVAIRVGTAPDCSGERITAGEECIEQN
ncbi:MAG: hypothetical protein GF344_14870 [Chitinivibrionales bacterium]|nr:hypothetical protein [Chitinivibrionales bacterium]MBD3357990.1 hypothetical protein [Chitinivibrionales bacterium]